MFKNDWEQMKQLLPIKLITTIFRVFYFKNTVVVRAWAKKFF